MAIPNTSLHTRSISLPPKSDPLNASIEDQLRRLSTSQVGPSSSSSLCQNLIGIKDLYEQVNNLIHLPHNQKALLCKGLVEEVLEGSLVLLDASSSAIDAVSKMKESVLDLESSLRRGNSEQGIHAYLMSRKKISKIVSKCLADIKKAEKKCSGVENEAVIMRILKEAEIISLSTLKSVLLFVMGKKAAISQPRGWSMVKKLVRSKNESCESEECSEVEGVDRALRSVSEKQLGLLKQLEALETVIQHLEDGLEVVSRGLVKTRVSLLNLFNY